MSKLINKQVTNFGSILPSNLTSIATPLCNIKPSHRARRSIQIGNISLKLVSRQNKMNELDCKKQPPKVVTQNSCFARSTGNVLHL